jgi:Spermine/spermidine synthase domain
MTREALTGPSEEPEGAPKTAGSYKRKSAMLFLASFVALYFELAVIRYLSSEIRVFAYLKNLALIASFFGIGMGMILGKPPVALKRFFPLITAAVFLIIAFASPLKLTHVAFPAGDYVLFGDMPNSQNVPWANLFDAMSNPQTGPRVIVFLFLTILEFLIVVPAMMYLIMAFFMVLGGIVGQHLAFFQPLRGYGINLAGSLAGILAFTLLSLLRSPPAVWVLVGLLVSLPFFVRDRRTMAVFAFVVGALAIAHPKTYWSPYYRIEVHEIVPPEGWHETAAYLVSVNHDYHQEILNLSPDFIRRFPDEEPYRSGLASYELPYRVVPHPGRVLVVGAGTGNDVAAALRHGAMHVDAVEIDPVIQGLGQKFHPEHPYDSPRVTVHLDDARAYFKKAKQKYGLIVFGYLDSHTLLTSMSSIRLDNYVYTLESFGEAKNLLAKDGTLVLGFSSGKTFLGDRMFATLFKAFGVPPHAYFVGGASNGVVYIETTQRSNLAAITDFPDISHEFESRLSQTTLATDHWPFLYLRSRTIPLSILFVLLLFLYIASGIARRKIPLGGQKDPRDFHLFFLGAGFMLLETKGVTELSLLFGSTWVVNSVVISSFLIMGMLANALVAFRPVSRLWAYCGLFLLLSGAMFLPDSLLNALPAAEKIIAAGTLVGLPVFFSGLIFSRSFQNVAQPERGLGINLVGAVIGGVLENLVMVGGTPILAVLALVLYGLSAVALWPKVAAPWQTRPVLARRATVQS